MNSAFIEPLDALVLRGNRLFGEPGSHSDSRMPPWPSVAAGALRSHLMASAGIEAAAFARPEVFTLKAFTPARRAGERVEPLFPVPADLLGTTGERNLLRPARLAEGITTSNPLPQLPLCAQRVRSKAQGQRWLTARGLAAWQRGAVPAEGDFIASSALWSDEVRVGVGLDALTRHAEDGQLFTSQCIVARPGVGFAVRFAGTSLPPGMLRFGGDGRAARVEPACIDWPEPDWQAIAAAGRARLMLLSPGLFPLGWLPTGCRRDPDGAVHFSLRGVQGRVVAASVPRPEVVSGFDLVRRAPKAASRMAPIGSVWWLDELEATPAALRKLADEGLWPEGEDDAGHEPQRRAEGFNRFTFAIA